MRKPKTWLRTLGLGALIGLLFVGLGYVIDPLGSGPDRIGWPYAAIVVLYGVVLTAVNRGLQGFLDTRYPWDRMPRKRYISGILGSVLATVGTFFLLQWITAVILKKQDARQFISGQSLGEYALVLVLTLIISFIFHAFKRFRIRQEKQVAEQKILAGSAAASFDALKNQLDPHFLFNSLNVLSSLIEENPPQAQKFTTALSKVYRYVLEQKNKELVPLDEELRFARTYIDLLKMRFEEGIIVEIPEKAQDPEAMIVPLSLQLLLENAVKHNIVGEDRPLTISVSEGNGNLVVENGIQIKQAVREGAGVGLRNIRQRYALLTPREVTVEKTANTFRVSLPVMHKATAQAKDPGAHIQEKRYRKAVEKVAEVRKFYGNLVSFCLVIPLLWGINIFYTSGIHWAIFPTIGWGMGLAFNAVKVFWDHPFLGKRWEEHKIRQFMDRDDFRSG